MDEASLQLILDYVGLVHVTVWHSGPSCVDLGHDDGIRPCHKLLVPTASDNSVVSRRLTVQSLSLLLEDINSPSGSAFLV